MTKTVYLAGPITGLTYEDARFGWRKEYADGLKKDGIKVLSPMRHEGHLAEIKGPLQNEYTSHLFSHGKMIVAKDYLDIEVCDLMVARFIGATKPSLGTVGEIGYAKRAGKTIVVVMENDNLHHHPFVTEPASIVVNNDVDALTIIRSLLSEGV